jgi:hypothetical protein
MLGYVAEGQCHQLLRLPLTNLTLNSHALEGVVVREQEADLGANLGSWASIREYEERCDPFVTPM